MSLNRKMSNKHEEDLAEAFQGRVMPGSGNQYNNPMDVRNDIWAIDGKSTRNKSISVTREMLDKAKEQAQGQRPMVALRFYDDDRLKQSEDWVLVRLDDLLEETHCSCYPYVP